VLQLIILGSLARTVRIRTVYAALAVGLYLLVPLTVVLQAGWTGLCAPLFGLSAPELVRIASYTFDPFLEELLKLLPLALLLLVPTFRRQWSFTDLVLIGAAAGAGFGLAEDIYRFGGSADRAQSISGGWALVFSQGSLLVPSIGKTLTSWLPIGVAGGSSDVARLNVHLVWSAVGGLAVGLAVLSRSKAARWAALGLLVYISLDHAAGNMTNIGDSWLAFLSWPLGGLVHLRGLMPIAALAAAWWLDQRRQGNRDSLEPLLMAEQSASPRWKGTLGAAFSRLPWSLISVDRFVRMRRAFRAERTATTAQSTTLNALVVNERDRVDRELAQLQTEVPALWPPGWTMGVLRAALRRPAVIIWLVILTPSVLWFVVGGWPQTAGLQAFMTQPAVWMVLFPITVLAQAWISWRTIAGLRSWPQTREASTGDNAAFVGLRIACGIGAVSLGAFSLLRMLGGVAPGSSILASLHAQGAANRLTPNGGSMVGNSAGAFAPPPPSLDLPDQASSSSSSPSSGTSNSNAKGTSPSPSNNKTPAPAPPDEAAAARARADAAAADLEAARQRRLQAQRDTESKDIKKANEGRTDPEIVDAQERVRAAHDAAISADVAAADDFTDPWGKKSPERIAADETREAARDAEAQRDKLMEKLDEEAEAAKAAEKQADADVTEAEGKVELAKAEADAQTQAAQTAAAQKAAAQQRAADPEGAAADDAAKAAADAQQAADKAFYGQHDPDGAKYHEALEAAKQAQQQADAARAAADAAKTAREKLAARNSSTGWKPDKP
jgi:RsiW-degrading membrane proteinase PrsW (M82 family)